MRISKKMCKEVANSVNATFWARGEFFENKKPLVCLNDSVYEFKTNRDAFFFFFHYCDMNTETRLYTSGVFQCLIKKLF